MKRLYSERPRRTEGYPRSFSSQSKEYLTKVATLVPSEIIAGFIGVMALSESVTLLEPDIIHWGIFTICLVLTPFYFNMQARKTDPKFMHILISTIAYIIWVYATKGDVLVPDYYEESLAGVVLIVFSLISGLIPLPEKKE